MEMKWKAIDWAMVSAHKQQQKRKKKKETWW